MKILLWLCAAFSATSAFPLKLLPIPVSLLPETNLTVLFPQPNQFHSRSAYLLTTTESWSVIVPHSDSNNNTLERTSVQAARNHCLYAANGGPFSPDGSCVGAVISNGRTVTGDFRGGVGFGLAAQQQQQLRYWWVIGSIENAEQAAALGLQQFVTGFDWLVYDGKAVANQFNNTTGAEAAPRTAIGVNQEGKLMLLVVDGCELWYVENPGSQIMSLICCFSLSNWFLIFI
jgi:Phosphodiester glycosidase